MSYRGTRRTELIATRQCTRWTSVLVLRTEQFSTRKSSVLPISKLSILDFSCSVGFFWVGQWERIRCAVQVDRLSGLRRVCPASCTNFLSKKKKKNYRYHWPLEKSNNRQKKKDSCRNKGQENWRGWQDERFTVFCIAKLYEQDRAPVRMPRL